MTPRDRFAIAWRAVRQCCPDAEREALALEAGAAVGWSNANFVPRLYPTYIDEARRRALSRGASTADRRTAAYDWRLALRSMRYDRLRAWADNRRRWGTEHPGPGPGVLP